MERRFVSCFENGIQGQESGLADLLHAASLQDPTEVQLRVAIEHCMQGYEEYSEQRGALEKEVDGVTSFVCPRWCGNFERSALWIGGCRPSLMIWLLYSLSGIEIEALLEDFLQGQRCNGGLMNLSARQLQLVNELHLTTLCAKDRLTSKQASLQEDVADRPLFPIVRARQQGTASRSSPIQDNGCVDFDAGEISEHVAAAMQTHADSMAKLLEEADSLRLETAN